MVCSEFFNLLDNYENLTETEISVLDSHSVECENCRNEYEFFKSITNTVSALPCPEPPQDLIAKVNEQLDKMPPVTGKFNIFMTNIKNNTYRYATIAACLAVGLVVGLNNKLISERLTNKDNDGVISTSTITETATDEPIVEDIEASVPVAEPAPAPAVTVEKKAKKPEKTEKKASVTVKKEVKKTPVATSAPVVVPTPEVIEISEPEVPASDNQPETTAPVIEKDAKGKYTIARGVYYIPETTEQPVATEEPEAVEDYSLVAGDYQIAIGYYDIPEEKMKKPKTEEFSEQLIVSVNDVVEVTAYMSTLGAINSGRGYQMPIADFYELLSILDSEGIPYRYSSGANLSDTIIFSLVTY